MKLPMGGKGAGAAVPTRMTFLLSVNSAVPARAIPTRTDCVKTLAGILWSEGGTE